MQPSKLHKNRQRKYMMVTFLAQVQRKEFGVETKWRWGGIGLEATNKWWRVIIHHVKSNKKRFPELVVHRDVLFIVEDSGPESPQGWRAHSGYWVREPLQAQCRKYRKMRRSQRSNQRQSEVRRGEMRREEERDRGEGRVLRGVSRGRGRGGG